MTRLRRLQRAAALILAIGCAGFAAYCLAGLANLAVATLTAPDHGGDLWLFVLDPLLWLVVVLGAASGVAAGVLFAWWRRTAEHRIIKP